MQTKDNYVTDFS